MELAILGVFVVSVVSGIAVLTSAVVVRRRHVGERTGVASGRLMTGIVLIALPLVLGLLGLVLAMTVGPGI